MRIKAYSIFFIFLAVSLYVPYFDFGIRLRAEDFIALIFLIFVPFLIQRRGLNLTLPIIAPLIIFVFMFVVFGILQSIVHLDEVIVPTELWQYVKRIVFFMIGYMTYYASTTKQNIKRNKFFLIVVFGYLIIGCSQIYANPLGEYFISLYPRSEGQFEIAMANDNKRIFGISGHSISWGGFSGFLFFAGIFCLVSFRMRTVEFYILSIVLFLLSSLNVVFSGSRVAMAAYVISLLVLWFLIFFNRPLKVLKYSFVPFILLFGISIGALHVFNDQIMYIIFRFDVLLSNTGGGRFDQISSAMKLLVTPIDSLIGVSNSIQRALGVDHGVEVEPINLLVNYGILGLFFIYGSLLVIMMKLRSLTKSVDNRITFHLLLAMYALYVVFSLGYFFFAEIVVGAYPFLVFGILLGSAQKNKEQFFENDPVCQVKL